MTSEWLLHIFHFQLLSLSHLLVIIVAILTPFGTYQIDRVTKYLGLYNVLIRIFFKLSRKHDMKLKTDSNYGILCV